MADHPHPSAQKDSRWPRAQRVHDPPVEGKRVGRLLAGTHRPELNVRIAECIQEVGLHAPAIPQEYRAPTTHGERCLLVDLEIEAQHIVVGHLVQRDEDSHVGRHVDVRHLGRGGADDDQERRHGEPAQLLVHQAPPRFGYLWIGRTASSCTGLRTYAAELSLYNLLQIPCHGQKSLRHPPGGMPTGVQTGPTDRVHNTPW